MRAASLRDRYDEWELLGEGSFSRVYRVRSRTDGHQYVVKQLKEFLPLEAALRVRQEASILAQLRHPHIVDFVGVELEDGRPSIITSYVPATDLKAVLGKGRLPVGEALRIGVQLAAGLAAVHQKGVFHGDLKPANVLVQNPQQPGQAHVHLIDFGLSHASSRQADQAVQGTAAYMAPEQTRLRDAPLDHRADLYAAGLILFELFSGRTPFVFHSFADALEKHAFAPAPPLRSIDRAVPVVLSRVVEKLLEKDPGDRYRSAESLERDLQRVAEADDPAALAEMVLDSLPGERQPKLAVSLAGRHRELDQLRAATTPAEAAAHMVLVGGRSGVGKSRLISEFLRRSTAQSGLTLETKCHRGCSAIPYQPITDMLDAHLEAVARRPGFDPARFAGRVREVLGEDVAMAVQLVPRLRALGVGVQAAANAAPDDRQRENEVLRMLLEELRPAEGRLILVIDDLQWADNRSLRFVLGLAEGAARDVLVIGSLRSDELIRGGDLERLYTGDPRPAVSRIHLEPLTEEAITDIVCEALATPAAQLPVGLPALVIRQSQGAPLYALELLHRLHVEGALVHDDERWVLHRDRAEQLDLSLDLVDLIRHRVAQASPACVDLLRHLAVADRVLRFDQLAALCPLAELDVLAAVDEALAARILKDLGAEGYAFAHDKLQEAVTAQLTPDRAAALHLRTAAFLIDAPERPDGELAPEIADHLHHAPRREDTLDWQLRAAEVSLRRSLVRDASRFLVQAEAAAGGPLDDATRLRVAVLRAHTLRKRGRYREAAEICEELLNQPIDDDARLELLQISVSASVFGADSQRTADHYYSTLKLLGYRLPRSTLGAFVWAQLMILKVLLRLLLPAWCFRRVARGTAEARRLKTITNVIADGNLFWYSTNAPKALCGVFSSLELTHRVPDFKGEQAIALSYAGVVVASFGLPGVARRVIDAGHQRALASGDPVAIALCKSLFPVVGYTVATWDDELPRRAHESLAILQELEDNQLSVYAANCVAGCHVWRGEFDEVLRLAERYRDHYERIPLAHAFINNVHVVTHFQLGLDDAQQIHDANLPIILRTHNNLEHYNHAINQARLHLWRGEHREAIAAHKAALWFGAKRLVATPALIVAGASQLVEACLERVHSGSSSRGEQRRLRRTARRFARLVRLARWIAPGLVGLDTFVRGLLELDAGRADRAFQRWAHVDEGFPYPTRPTQTRLLLARARWARRHGRRDLAVGWLGAARDSAETLRARFWVQECVKEAEALRATFGPDVDEELGFAHPGAIEAFRRAVALSAMGDLHDAQRHARQAISSVPGLSPDSDSVPPAAAGPGDSSAALQHTLGQRAASTLARTVVLAQRNNNFELAALVQVGQLVSATLDPDEGLDRIAGATFDVLRATAVFAYRQHRDGRFLCQASRGPLGPDDEDVQAAFGAILPEVQATLQVQRAEGAGWFGAPIVRNNRCVGVLMVKADHIGGTARDLLEILAGQAAVALTNAEQYQTVQELNANLEKKVETRTAELVAAREDALNKELQIARQIQLSMVPRAEPHEFSHSKVYGLVQPASACGGDCWALHDGGDRGVFVFVGDVTGHGLGAAMVTAVAKTAWDLAVRREDLAVDGVLGEINTVIREATGGDLLMTAIAVHLPCGAGPVTVASAGHCPHFMVRGGGAADRTVKAVPLRGDPLGMSASPQFGLTTLDVAEGDRLLLYTDGVTEAANADHREFGRRRLSKSLQAHFGHSLPAAIDAVYKDVIGFSGGDFDDDLTLVVVECGAPASPAG